MLEEFGEICVVIILIIGVMFLTVMLCSFANKKMEKEMSESEYMTLSESSFEIPEPKKPELYYQVINKEKEDKARLEAYYKSLEP